MLALYFWTLMTTMSFLAYVNLKKVAASSPQNFKKYLHILTAMLLFCMIVIGYFPQDIMLEHAGFIFTRLSLSLVCLTLFLSIAIQNFSLKYMQIDDDPRPFFFKISILTLSSVALCVSNHIGLIMLFWLTNQILLSRLIAHVPTWAEARASGKLYLKTAVLSSGLLALALTILGLNSHTLYLSEFKATSTSPVTIAMILFSLAAMIQAGTWPFHRWLVSSLNSPTPVSAFMHAGLVSSGACLLIRLAPQLHHSHSVLGFIFTLGCLSVLLATVMKLVQSSVKKMLAFSTVSQMGYMFMQIGLGLFPQALAHIISHSLFKGFLFLNSGSHIQKTTKTSAQTSLGNMLFALLSAALSCLYFVFAMKLSLKDNAHLFMLIFPFASSFQMTLSLKNTLNQKAFLVAPLASLCMGALYVFFMHSAQHFMPPTLGDLNVPLNSLHYTLLALIGFMLLFINLGHSAFFKTRVGQKIYVLGLNHSQSCPSTVSSSRNTFTL